MNKPVMQNVRWPEPGLIATGQKPYLPEHVQWLIDNEFHSVISLEDIPDLIILAIKKVGIRREFFDLEDFSDSGGFDVSKVPREFFDCFAECLARLMIEAPPVYVHCSFGIKRSPAMVERFIRRKRKAQKDSPP